MKPKISGSDVELLGEGKRPSQGVSEGYLSLLHEGSAALILEVLAHAQVHRRETTRDDIVLDNLGPIGA